MTMRMLIDARHREETRVAVVKGNRIEEFDFESAEHKQLKGNIYLAKVTRVEPSLQAAFVEYGGNRHGFLAFSEIHPDYYQIPKEDREALLREEAEAADAAMRAEEELDALEGDIDDMQPPAAFDDDHHGDDGEGDEDQGSGDEEREARDGDGEDAAAGEDGGNGDQRGRGRGRGRRRSGRDRDDRDEASERRQALRRRYKIQDVIRRRQVLLVQVVKEERGNKGAALTSYLSLAGRYCVLMPNSSHGGGISRKISNGADRRRLKSVIDELALPPSMGCIVRTAGLERTKTEIKRDFDYLARLWDEIRDRTLKSAAPALIHSDSDLIKRAIRDIYHREIEEVLVEGEDGYRAAKDFMKLLMPSHARRVKHYADPVPLLQRFGVEDQLGAMYQPVVPLKSGGYLVINPTEALVSIDINSGRSTREHNIEQTAVSTNLEAAYEIARQLRLRDMAGLVVIDFIDMDMGSNVRKVERAMREALKNDRARIQVGRISGFGLMEMSRQRLRTGVLEASTRACPHCEGTGLVRTASSAGLSALRLLEEEAARGRGSRLVMRASEEAAFYLLNNKRAELTAIEQRYGVSIAVQSDGQTEGARMTVEASGPPPVNLPRLAPIVEPDSDEEFVDEDDRDEDEEGQDERAPRRDGARGEGDRSESDREERRRKRRRKRRGGRRDEPGSEARPEGEDGEAGDAEQRDAEAGDDERSDAERSEGERGERSEGEDGTRRRRRGRRGGRGRRAGDEGLMAPGGNNADGEIAPGDAEVDAAADVEAPVASVDEAVPVAEAAPARKPRRRKKTESTEDAATADAEAAPEARVVDAPAAEDAEPAKPAPRKRAPRKAKAAAADGVATAPATDEAAPAKPRRSRARKQPVEAEADAVVADTAPVAEAVMPFAVETVAEVAPEAVEFAKTEPAEAAPAEAAPAEAAPVDAAPADATATAPEEEVGPPRRGWWQRTFGA